MTLVESVVSGILLCLSHFKMPISVSKDIKRFMKNFLWEGVDERERLT